MDQWDVNQSLSRVLVKSIHALCLLRDRINLAAVIEVDYLASHTRNIAWSGDMQMILAATCGPVREPETVL